LPTPDGPPDPTANPASRTPRARSWVAGAVATGRELTGRFEAARGSTLAAAISLRGFLALFPVLLLALGALGFAAASTDGLATRLVNQLGLDGEAARTVTDAVEAARRRRVTSGAVGLVGLLWTGTGLAAVLADAWDQVWAVPGRPLRARGRGLLWLAGGLPLAVASLGATTLSARRGLWLPVGFVAGAVVTGALLWWTAAVLPRRRLDRRRMVPAAAAGGVAVEIVKSAAAVVLPPVVTRASTTYGTIGVAFAILVWFMVLGRIVVWVAVLEHWRAPRATAPPGAAAPGSR